MSRIPDILEFSPFDFLQWSNPPLSTQGNEPVMDPILIAGLPGSDQSNFRGRVHRGREEEAHWRFVESHLVQRGGGQKINPELRAALDQLKKFVREKKIRLRDVAKPVFDRQPAQLGFFKAKDGRRLRIGNPQQMLFSQLTLAIFSEYLKRELRGKLQGSFAAFPLVTSELIKSWRVTPFEQDRGFKVGEQYYSRERKTYNLYPIKYVDLFRPEDQRQVVFSLVHAYFDYKQARGTSLAPNTPDAWARETLSLLR